MIFYVTVHDPEVNFVNESECAHKLFEEIRKVLPYKSFDIRRKPEEDPVLQWNGGNNQ
jgi:hypothetical protein